MGPPFHAHAHRGVSLSRLLRIIAPKLLILLTPLLVKGLRTKPFQVCTNKTCSKQGSSKTASTFSILKQKVETHSCVSKCGEGPNILAPSGRVYNGVKPDATTLISAIIEIETGEAVPTSVMTAVSLVAEADHASEQDEAKNEKLSKAVKLLVEYNMEKSANAAYGEALAVAYTSRSALALKSYKSDRRYEDLAAAKNDAKLAIASCNTVSKSYWNLAEIYEIENRFAAATECLLQMEKVLPDFSETIGKEVARLQTLQQ